MSANLPNIVWNFKYYKTLGEKAIEQIEDSQINVQVHEESNSIALIIKHLAGNMRSRWTDFLTTDGEKPCRDRDSEFEGGYPSKEAMITDWESGWQCLFTALDALTEADLEKIIYIRNQGLTVLEAIYRQLTHYPYHVGQIVFMAKVLKGKDWETLSVARNKSKAYNASHFEKPKEIKNFDDIDFYTSLK